MRRFILLLVSLIMINGLNWAQQNEISDTDISNAIEVELQFDHAINVAGVEVDVTDGIAELSGTVADIKAKKRAAKIAGMVKGVRSVANRIKVEPAVNYTDEGLERKVTVALFNDPAADTYQVKVEVHHGKLTLTGEVDSYQEKQLAGNVASSVVGIRELNNNIKINYDINRTDAEIKKEVESTLKWSKLVDDAMINVQVDNAEVYLSGIAGSSAEKQNARAVAWVTGVTKVNTEELDVEWFAKDTNIKRDREVYASEQEIKQAIKDAFAYDPRVKSFKLNVEVDDGWVELSGDVDNMKSKKAAENIARNTMGVKSVENKIEVIISEVPGDKEVRADIIAALQRNAITESYEIDVIVNAGIVTLTGVVDSYTEKLEAGWVASGVAGVVDLNNLITVNQNYSYYWWGYTPYFDWYFVPQTGVEVVSSEVANDAAIKEAVKDQLWWSPYVTASDVSVHVDNGEVTLEGKVETLREYENATINAWEGGAWDVDNNLEIK